MGLLSLFQLNLFRREQPIDYDLLRGKALFAEPLQQTFTAQPRGNDLAAEPLPRMLSP